MQMYEYWNYSPKNGCENMARILRAAKEVGVVWRGRAWYTLYNMKPHTALSFPTEERNYSWAVHRSSVPACLRWLTLCPRIWFSRTNNCVIQNDAEWIRAIFILRGKSSGGHWNNHRCRLLSACIRGNPADATDVWLLLCSGCTNVHHPPNQVASHPTGHREN